MHHPIVCFSEPRNRRTDENLRRADCQAGKDGLSFPYKLSRSAFGCFSRDHNYLALSRNNCPFAEKKKKNFMKAHAYCCLSCFAAGTPTPRKRWRIHHADAERVARPSHRWALGRILYLWFVLKSSLLCPGAFSL